MDFAGTASVSTQLLELSAYSTWGHPLRSEKDCLLRVPVEGGEAHNFGVSDRSGNQSRCCGSPASREAVLPDDFITDGRLVECFNLGDGGSDRIIHGVVLRKSLWQLDLELDV